MKLLTLKDFLVASAFLWLAVYISRETVRDVVIIDPITVPKRFEESGLTSEVMANRIGDALREIEAGTRTRMKKDDLASLRDETAKTDVEIPGTRLGIRTIIEITRDAFGFAPRHVSGDIVLQFSPVPVAGDAPKAQATLTIYITEGRKRGPAVAETIKADDTGPLVRRAAEMTLAQINPYLCAAYLENRREYGRAADALRSLIQNPPADRSDHAKVLDLWGNILKDQKKYPEAISAYKASVLLAPRDPHPLNGWGNVLLARKDFDGAIAKYAEAARLDPAYAYPHYNWGLSLSAKGSDGEALKQLQEAIALDANFAFPHNEIGNFFLREKKYGEAAQEYSRAARLDQGYAPYFNNWGVALYSEGRFEEAIEKYSLAISIDPSYALPYDNWGLALSAQMKNEESIAKYTRAIELEPQFAQPYLHWSQALRSLNRNREAEEKLLQGQRLQKYHPYDLVRNGY
jgi:tetratricopeptide (TPR) repeat protein